MTGAMYAAVSGLKTHMSALNVIGNNISNVNTYGYKATRYTFNEALYTTVQGGSNGTTEQGGRNPAQIGYGCSVGTIDLDMSTKTYAPTGQAMDCMIDGDGFFLMGDKVNTAFNNQGDLKGLNLSRLGNIEFKADGYLSDGNGSVVYGFMNVNQDPTGDPQIATVLTPIRLPFADVVETQIPDTDPPQYTVATEIYMPRTVNDGRTITGTSEQGVIVRDGQRPEGSTLTTSLERLQPDTVALDKSGTITIMTKDGKQVVLGVIAIAKVDSPNGVTHVDGRYYQALGGAGNIHLTTIGGSLTYSTATTENENQQPAGQDENAVLNGRLDIESSGGTKLVTGGLESSGTDLAQEISNMIVIQRGYQANTRIVTVTDSMLEELVNMKR